MNHERIDRLTSKIIDTHHEYEIKQMVEVYRTLELGRLISKVCDFDPLPPEVEAVRENLRELAF